jgi:CheY-like chemotaxis protein
MNDYQILKARAVPYQVASGSAALEPLPHPANEQDKHRDSQPRRVLVVDDNKDAREMMAALLQEFGHLVQIAQDGTVALELALDFQPHVVLLDLKMPGMSGFTLAEKIRAEPVLWDTLLINITGWQGEDSERLSKQAGCNYHLLKPLDPFLLEFLLNKNESHTKSEGV